MVMGTKIIQITVSSFRAAHDTALITADKLDVDLFLIQEPYEKARKRRKP